tara:strand:+ start:177 stop:335 length:159 start_codon:yes stop_codon:yes gene_type:complete
MANLKANFYENYVLVFKDGTQKPVNEATPQEVSQAISIVRMKNEGETTTKNP